MSRGLRVTFVASIASIALVFTIAVAREVWSQEAPTPAETVCMRAAAASIVTIMRLESAVAELQGQIAKRKQEDEDAAKVKTP